MTLRPLTTYQLRAWLAVALAGLLTMSCMWLSGAVAPRTPRQWPRWLMEGSVVVSGDPVRVTGPDGQAWYVVSWRWRDMYIESVHTGESGAREAEVLTAVLRQRMVGR